MNIKLVVRGDNKEYLYDSYELSTPHILPIGLLDNVNYAIGVDPSTTCTGVVIGNLVDYQADIFIELKRNRELDETEFNRNIYTMFSSIFENHKDKIQGVQVETPFKSKYTTHDKFAKQKANFKIWESISTRFDIDFFKVAPQAWRGTFTKTYGHLIKGDLRKITKSQIKGIYAGRGCIELMNFGTDMSDAYGIYQHYLAVNMDSFTASKEREREYSHEVIYVITERKHLGSYVRDFLMRQSRKNPDAKVVAFNYCQQLTPEENIRCFTSAKTIKKYNVYSSVFYPNVSIMKHLYKYRESMPDLVTEDTELYLIGFRTN